MRWLRRLWHDGDARATFFGVVCLVVVAVAMVLMNARYDW